MARFENFCYRFEKRLVSQFEIRHYWSPANANTMDGGFMPRVAAWRRLGYNDILFREKSHMPAFIVLLRAVNVGGTGKLPMAELKAMCVAAGFSKVQTYIASGNVVFETEMPPTKIRAALEARLKSYAGEPIGVVVRTLDEMAAVLKSNLQTERSRSFSISHRQQAPLMMSRG
jgi:Protein of unknown function (DUF1697)